MPPAKPKMLRPTAQSLCWQGNVQTEANQIDDIYNKLKADPETKETKETVRNWYNLVMDNIEEKATSGYCVKVPFGRFSLALRAKPDGTDGVRVAFKPRSNFKNLPPRLVKEVQARTGMEGPPKRASSGTTLFEFMKMERAKGNVMTSSEAGPLYKAWKGSSGASSKAAPAKAAPAKAKASQQPTGMTWDPDIDGTGTSVKMLKLAMKLAQSKRPAVYEAAKAKYNAAVQAEKANAKATPGKKAKATPGKKANATTGKKAKAAPKR